MVSLTPREVPDINVLARLVTQYNWSPAIFRKNYRLKDNFLATEFVAVDVDEGSTIEQAVKRLKFYQYVIGTTRNHLKIKNNKLEERFRVIFPLQNQIQDTVVYEATIRKAIDLIGAGDRQTIDAARFFYPCETIVAINEDGAKLAPAVTQGSKGLSQLTRDFLQHGAKPGERNHRLFKAAVDMHEQSIEYFQCQEQLMRAALSSGLSDSEARRTIESAFSRVPRYAPRAEQRNDASMSDIRNHADPLSRIASLIERHFSRHEADKGPSDNYKNFISVDHREQLITDYKLWATDKDAHFYLSTGLKHLDEILGGGLRKGDLGVWQAPSKTGKNCLWHYIMWQIMTQFNVDLGYASREMNPVTDVFPDMVTLTKGSRPDYSTIQEAEVDEHVEILKKLPLHFTKGIGFICIEDIEEWIRNLHAKTNCEYFFIDHYEFLLEDTTNLYLHSKEIIQRLTSITRQLNVHISLIVQPRKIANNAEIDKSTMKGGSSVDQAMDWLICMDKIEDSPDPHLRKVWAPANRRHGMSTVTIYVEYNPVTGAFRSMPNLPAVNVPDAEKLQSILKASKGVTKGFDPGGAALMD